MAASLVAGDRIKDIQYTTTLPEITAEVLRDPHALGVIPIENSTSGIVGPAQDSLVNSDVTIIHEVRIKVHYSLISHVPLEEVKQYFCHSVAFNQTMLFTSEHLSKAEVVYSNSNIHSGDLFMERPDEPVAAIIPEPAAHKKVELKGKVIADGIQDHQDNITRFVVIRKKPKSFRPDFNRNRTSIYVELHEDRHSLLFELLREFHVFGINICRLESRPSRKTPWSYGFFIDFDNEEGRGHLTDRCLEGIKSQHISYQLLGTYDFIPEPQ